MTTKESTSEAATCWIDDSGPYALVQPRSVPEVGDVVRRAAKEGQAIYPLSGQTMLDFGLPPDRPGVAVDLRLLDQVIDYPARDMTITVQAGITIARLQELLRTEGQQLPIDVPQAERATLGGILATNTSGSRRYGFGTLRDYVIGISAVNDEGQEIKAGGRVVKNVAGYDLCKLFIGSLGTLGIITQVTLKLKPRAEETAFVALGCEAAALGLVLDTVHGSRTRPTLVDAINGPAIRAFHQKNEQDRFPAPWVVLVGFEDSREAVAWQVQQLARELSAGSHTFLESRVGTQAAAWQQILVNTPALPEAQLTFKANMLPSTTADLCRQAEGLADHLVLHAHAGNGIVIGHVTDLTLERAQAMLKELQAKAASAGGNIVIRRCPSTWKRALPVWGAPRGDAWLMREVKQKLDPRRLFNPGRFVDGI